MKIHGPADKVLLPAGFRFSFATAGIKASGKPDLALADAPAGACAAATFTLNRMAAAPVLAGKEHLKTGRGRLRAVIINSGNANCATGAPGLRAAKDTCAALARALKINPSSVLPSSTGIIGVPLPVNKILSAIPRLVAGLAQGEQALRSFGKAIMTTDLTPKLASASFKTRAGTVSIAGVAKGSGMIHPNMATMLVYIFCDIAAAPAALRRQLKAAVEVSFNAISVDGDTSTNDTVLLLASGASGVKLTIPGVAAQFARALRAVCASLAEQVVRDGEGAGHLVRLRVEGARSSAEARRVARAIANSPLVKTSWAGCDPNWGRLFSTLGNTGIPVDPARVRISIGPHRVFDKGKVKAFDRAAAHAVLKRPEYVITVGLGLAKASAEFLTCDLTEEYIRINAEYST
ncbi:MAG: bifunctional ornithine acetyltransferase/N-acetylglutamate synthase [Elusimicrobia bacterium RIFOXYA2_FULL_58_8]|nr:MAG: bifunctional ornithine acetyltransferase/N-acetylglutamate synthase [Elusimicrobia bacterium RIFOXYA2_FULL_58_8]